MWNPLNKKVKIPANNSAILGNPMTINEFANMMSRIQIRKETGEDIDVILLDEFTNNNIDVLAGKAIEAEIDTKRGFTMSLRGRLVPVGKDGERKLRNYLREVNPNWSKDAIEKYLEGSK